MQVELTFDELEKSINKLMLFLFSNDNAMYNTCLMLKSTGLRFSELNFIYWKEIDILNYAVFITKTNSVRYIQQSLIPIDFILYLNTFVSFDYVLNYSTFKARWKTLSLPVFNTLGVKNICAHIFRYYYIRKLQNEGLTPPDIMLNIGHTQISTTKNYLFNKIYLL